MTYDDRAARGPAALGEAESGAPAKAGVTVIGSREPGRDALPAGYRPSASEPYMNPRQLLYFRLKLEALRQTVPAAVAAPSIERAGNEVGDEADGASRMIDGALEVHANAVRVRALAEIDAALRRIADGSYGYCDETGDPIGVARLEAKPTATLSITAQSRIERQARPRV